MEEIFGLDLEIAALERFLDNAPIWPGAVVIEGEIRSGVLENELAGGMRISNYVCS